MPEFTKYKFDNFVARRVELTEFVGERRAVERVTTVVARPPSAVVVATLPPPPAQATYSSFTDPHSHQIRPNHDSIALHYRSGVSSPKSQIP
ncbi:hypothetical protein JYU34_016338 [Plutella xylostella]|uniref:Uncharacterized protein n=1 Tax=Plutella xylostella TaxID=51655 RepID=A0ABQ7Q2D8_PLUXY|nr:hypothetical protein JYU34_016338 [Plutella xylostella]